MRIIMLPLYELHELSTEAHSVALKGIRDVRMELFVEHELPELLQEIKTIANTYGFEFVFSRLKLFSRARQIMLENKTFRSWTPLKRAEMVAQWNAVYLNTTPVDSSAKTISFEQALGEYTQEHGPVKREDFFPFVVRAMNAAAVRYLKVTEQSLDSDAASAQFAEELDYEFTERGDIFDQYMNRRTDHVSE